ncbi:MAG: DEAD/DEAH box helicase [Candidatus Omnitrophota bacterium]
MIILHAGWVEERLWIWGETPNELTTSSSSLRSLRNNSSIPFYSYDAGFALLSETLFAASLAPSFPQKDSRELFAWIPAKGERPFASSPLIGEPPVLRRKTALVPWRITALPLAAGSLISFLCSCVNKEMFSPGVLLGADLKYWAGGFRFAGSLAARQQFLPAIVEDKNVFRARWKPVLGGEDVKRKTLLAKAMPAACRALSLEENSVPDAAPETIAIQFIEAIVDGLARSQKPKMASFPSIKKKPEKITSFDSLHDQWLHALHSADGELDGGLDELRKLAEDIRVWRRPMDISASTPLRLCFRLEEPEEESELERKKRAKRKDWFVRYLLQDAADPSLLIPVMDAWTPKKRTAKLLERPHFSPTEYLLFSLGQASNVCVPIEASLKSAAPAGYEASAEGALEFLNESALLLEQMGFGVLLPSWWTGKGTKQRLSLKAKVKSPAMQGGGGLSLDEIIQFQWQAALGDEEISLNELLELAEMKSSLVKMRGQWVHIHPDEIQQAIEFWKKKTNEQTTLRDVIQMALGKANAPRGFDFAGVAAEGWVADFLDRLNGNASFEEQSPHPNFQGELRPYQRRGYSWLSFLREWGLGACLADDMGLGKTIQALALFQNERHNNGQAPVLLVCPTSVVGNWQKEAERFTPDLSVMIHHGLTRKKGEAFVKNASQNAIVITSYALLHRDFEILKDIRWSGVVLDEAQNIKNPETKQAKAARSLPADYRIALTGTPVENNVGDLWSIMEFLNPGFLGTQKEFKETFFIPIQALRDQEAIQRLKRFTGPFILRRLKTDKTIISDLPEKMEMKVYCNLTKEQASLYAAVVKDAEEQLESSEGIQRKGVVLATLSKLKQVCNHPAQFLGDNSAIPQRSGKLARLTEMLEEVLAVKDRAVIFSQFSEMGGILQRHLQEVFGQEIFFLHGGTPKKHRDRMVEQFQKDGGPNFFILSLKAGGTGLNLTQANHVFHFDRWWNPAVENQATDRAFRIGQTKNVQVHKFLCAGTLEERIDEMIESKKEIAGGVVGTGEAWLTELSTKELKKLFALSQDAVSE